MSKDDPVVSNGIGSPFQNLITFLLPSVETVIPSLETSIDNIFTFSRKEVFIFNVFTEPPEMSKVAVGFKTFNPSRLVEFVLKKILLFASVDPPIYRRSFTKRLFPTLTSFGNSILPLNLISPAILIFPLISIFPEMSVFPPILSLLLIMTFPVISVFPLISKFPEISVFPVMITSFLKFVFPLIKSSPLTVKIPL